MAGLSPDELNKKLMKIMGMKNNNKNKTCGALIASCKKCGLKFKKGETECPECGEPRKTCQRKPIVGSERCRLHGGKAGKKIQVDKNGIPLGYNQTEEQLKKKYAIKTFEDYIERVGIKCLMLLEEGEKYLNDNKEQDGRYSIDDLYEFFDKNMHFFKSLISYAKMRGEQRIIEITNERMQERIQRLKMILTFRCFAIAMNNFTKSLEDNISDRTLIDQIINNISPKIKEAYINQEKYFNASKEIIREIEPNIIEEDGRE